MSKSYVPGQIFFALFLDFNVEKNEGVKAKIYVLLDAIVEAVGLPCFCEEHKRDSLAKVVELETTGADRIHNGCIVDYTGGNPQTTSAKDDVGMSCST